MTDTYRITFDTKIIDAEDLHDIMKYIMNNWSQSIRMEKIN